MKILTKINIVVLVVFLSGCFSINYDFKGGVSIDPNIKTFSVQYIANKATLVEPLFSQTFTEEFKQHIENNTSLRLITGKGDVDFSGYVSRYAFTPQATTGERASKTRFTIAIKIKYSNALNPDEDFEREFSQFREIESTTTLSTVEAQLSEEIREEIIEQIFNAAFVNW